MRISLLRQLRRVRFLLVALVMVACLGALSLGAGGAAAAKITICHKPGTSSQGTLQVNEAELADHLAHGDTLGPCQPSQPTIAYTCSSSTLTYVRLYVRAGAKGAAKGTVEQPFGSVEAALLYAQSKLLPAVELQVADGVYPSAAIAITRHTRIVGGGRDQSPSARLAVSITNQGPFELGIQGLSFTASGLGPALTVSNAGASTALCDVGFDSAVGHAVSQSGGALKAADLVVSQTKRDPAADATPVTGDHITGSAMILAGGVDASLDDVQLDRSEGSGLHINGAGTVARLDWLGSSTSSITGGTGCLGAVVVAAGGKLQSRGTTLDGNRARGITVTGPSSLADFRRPTVTNTRFRGGSAEAMEAACGNSAVVGVLVLDGATLSMSGTIRNRFLISDSDVAGFLIAGPAVPVLHLFQGTVRNNLIGASVQFDCGSTDAIGRELVKLQFVDNGVDFDAPFICPPPPIPEWECDNGVDDDGDGLVDADDPDCASAPADLYVPHSRPAP